MIQECFKCKEDFLTEADPYLVYPGPSGVELICYKCYRKNIEDIKNLLNIAVPWVEHFAGNITPEDQRMYPWVVGNYSEKMKWIKDVKEVLK